MLAHGGDGGILAAARVETAVFLAVYERVAANDHQGARKAWSRVEPLVPLLFKEPNPSRSSTASGDRGSSARRSAGSRSLACRRRSPPSSSGRSPARERPPPLVPARIAGQDREGL